MNKPDNSRKALGKGLGALLPTRTLVITPAPSPPPPQGQDQERETASAFHVDIESIDANPLQPRRSFEEATLAELAQSIRANGIIQPLIVRHTGARFQLVAGERRWRAAKLAGIHLVPVVVRDIPDNHLLEITLIENIQREDLNPIETAAAFQRMSTELNLSPDEIGRRTGKDRSTIVNLMRLLQLPADLQQLLADRRLSAGHARSLLALPTVEQQREIAAKAVTQGWSVRQTEKTIQKTLEAGKPKSADKDKPDPNVKAAIEELERALGTKVRIVKTSPRQKGRIEIEYYSQDDLDRIYAVIVGEE
jgi:ParB family chromosome partitioning protein